MRFLFQFSLVCLFMGLAASVALAQHKSMAVSGVVAVVNGEMLSLQDLQRQCGPEIARAKINRNDPQADGKILAIQRKVLESMVVDKLISQEAQRLGIKVSDAEVEAQIQQILEQNKIDMPTLERSLMAQGLNITFLRDRIRNNQTNSRLMQVMVTQKVLVPEADIERYYNEHPGQFMKDKVVTLEVIIFPPHMHSDVAGIVKKIKNGSLSFEKAARSYSVGPEAKNGGKIGAVDWENISPLWRRALDGVKVGGLTPVFRIEEAEAIIKLVAETQGEPKTLREAEAEIERILKEPLIQERFKEYTQQLRNKAVIDVRL
ncbi:MAG: SurA N-terminal domain-containing protein [Desulfovibrionaceae bacterium]|nr:SurA N-terminal domain-containing protein [Desulfovibrionaceae bacterium]